MKTFLHFSEKSKETIKIGLTDESQGKIFFIGLYLLFAPV